MVKEPLWRKEIPEFKAAINECLEKAAQFTGLPAEAHVSFLLAGDEETHRLNREFRGKDKPANVLSFPAGEEDFLGDIALGLGAILKEAGEQGKKPEHHLRHLVVHGILHLLGYDHDKEKEREDMESLEIRILASMGVGDPY